MTYLEVSAKQNRGIHNLFEVVCMEVGNMRKEGEEWERGEGEDKRNGEVKRPVRISLQEHKRIMKKINAKCLDDGASTCLC